MECLGILWNSMSDFKRDVLQDIEKQATIKEQIDLELDESYNNFVRDIYAQDDIAQWKVDKKIEAMGMCSSSRQVTILLLDINTTTTYYHELKKRTVYLEMENLKQDIRGKYSKLVPFYFFDNVFHMTDDEEEYKADLKVINKYIRNIGNNEKINQKVKKIK